MSRFSVGKTYLFFTNHLRSVENPEKDITYYGVLGAGLNLVKTEVLELLCISEHDVPVEYREEEGNTAKGYIFIDAQGAEYHNQYPVASYGQMSDAGNRIVTKNDGEFTDFYLASSMLSEVNRILENKGETALADDAKQTVENVKSFLVSNGYYTEEELVLKTIKRTTIKESPSRKLVNYLRSQGFSFKEYPDQIQPDGRPYRSFSKVFDVLSVPEYFKKSDLDEADAKGLTVTLEISTSGDCLQYCLNSTDIEDYLSMKNPMDVDNRLSAYLLLEMFGIPKGDDLPTAVLNDEQFEALGKQISGL